ncbi:undecaprenyl-diphosphate phosphatase [Corynebacterium sp. 3HC-13]|nr:undecaprenyl-diphosphate phosphatase [Corynebacterium poyangense]
MNYFPGFLICHVVGPSRGVHTENRDSEAGVAELSSLHCLQSSRVSKVIEVSWLQTIVLSIVQGLTEFLPVSSSGHLRIVSELIWGHDAGASFTAVVQLGTELAVLVYFAKDIWRIMVRWFAGLTDKSRRGLDYRMGWMVIVGTIPVVVAGVLLKEIIRNSLRNLWLTATVLILFSLVFIIAERWGSKKRNFDDLTMKDAALMGLAQCLALIPGVSRSGGTISAGLLCGLNREVAARFSFLLAIPAVLGSGLFSLPDALAPEAGQAASGAQLAVGTIIAFLIGYASIAWLLRFVSHHSFAWFAAYRIPVGIIVMILLAAGTLNPI